MSNININFMKKIFVLFTILLSTINTFAYELSLDDVKACIIEYEIQHHEIVLKQAVQESGWYDSHESISCNSKNNLFGFRRNHEYITYDSWVESVQAYAVWQKKNYTGGDYYTFLVNIGYARDPEYISKLKSIRVS